MSWKKKNWVTSEILQLESVGFKKPSRLSLGILEIFGNNISHSWNTQTIIVWLTFHLLQSWFISHWFLEIEPFMFQKIPLFFPSLCPWLKLLPVHQMPLSACLVNTSLSRVHASISPLTTFQPLPVFYHRGLSILYSVFWQYIVVLSTSLFLIIGFVFFYQILSFLRESAMYQ